MNYFMFLGSEPRFYPQFPAPGSSFTATPGEVMQFDSPPGDSLWVQVQLSGDGGWVPVEPPELPDEPPSDPPSDPPADPDPSQESANS